MPDALPDPAPRPTRLADYRPPDFVVDTVDLVFDLGEADTRVASHVTLRRNPTAATPGGPLRLDGDEVELVALALDGRSLAPADYQREPDGGLVVPEVPDSFALDIETRINPQGNTALSGLYISGGNFCTQCEPEGFRRITYFLDRPDVMARYTVTIRADKTRHPVLLSNGNPAGTGDLADGRHWARWVDPHPKPSYLFALVAGDLVAVEDSFTTRSGRQVPLAIWVRRGDEDKCGHAMASLKKAMRWDEEVFGFEYDLDVFNIVAVSDFNMGAMENKGLNIFNTRYVLAQPATATDTDYQNIEAVIAHEYFHNWTGDRVTCRDWFQLSLKEGLTVFRDQLFSADLYSRAMTRIQEVRNLRAAQFPEDAGPMKHPVRPQSYMEIRNFYTMTVYEKGAEVVRMQHSLLGEEKFQAGMRLYFERHDGQAVTCDDFVQAMQDASGIDLSQFKLWYDVAGTPVLDCKGSYESGRFTLTVKQSMNPPFHIPLAVKIGPQEQVLSIKRPEEEFVFRNLKSKPVPSLLRRFSAPVILNYPFTEEELVHLMARDDDAFNRWEAGQRLAASIILDRKGAPSRAFLDASRSILSDRDPAFAAEALTLPPEAFLAEQMQVVDPDLLHDSRNELRRALAQGLKDELFSKYEELRVAGAYSPDAVSAGKRALRNLSLGFLSELGMSRVAYEQLQQADNMTDAMAALSCLANLDCPERQPALDAFYEKWQHEPLVVDKWLAVQSTSRLPDTLPRVKRLLSHPAFDIKVPNKVYALIRGFASNHVRFHAADGAGYAFLADQIIALNALNPQVAARMARAFDRWKRFDENRKAKARAALERVRDSAALSRDVMEIVVKSLG